MKPYGRAERLGSLIQEIVAEILEFEVKDRRLRRVSIVRVEVAQDLSKAKVFFDAGEDFHEAEEAFEKARGFIRSRLAKQLEIRYVPELFFYPVELWKDFTI